MFLRSFLCVVSGLFLFSAVVLLTGAPAQAQFQTAEALTGQDFADLKAEVAAAFQEVLDDPANLDKSFRYAELAIRIGDYEGAITSLERMLLFNPDLPRVRLELGVLYFRLGSHSTAKTYLQRALEDENVPEDVRTRVLLFLEEINRRTQRHRYSGSVFTGLRFQTNSNAGPSNRSVKVAGFDFELDDEFTEQEDYNFFVVGNLNHNYDMQNQEGDSWETSLTLYTSRQFDQSQLNLTFLQVDTGPRRKLMPDSLDNASMRPYVKASAVTLDDEYYFGTAGIGVNFTNQFNSRLAGNLDFSGSKKSYDATSSSPTLNQRSSVEREISAGIQYVIDQQTVMMVNASMVDESAKRDENSNREYALSLAFSRTYAPLITIPTADPAPWATSASITRQSTKYDDPDVFVDPDNVRHDKEWRFNLSTSVPVYRAFSLVGSLGHARVKSSIRNFEYDNTFVMLGANWRF